MIWYRRLSLVRTLAPALLLAVGLTLSAGPAARAASPEPVSGAEGERLRAIEHTLQEVVKRSAGAERRAGQARSLAWAILGANLLVPLLVLLLFSLRNWNLGQFLQDRALFRLRRRQLLLRQGLAALAAERTGGADREPRLAALLAVFEAELAALDRDLAARAGPADGAPGPDGVRTGAGAAA